MMLDLAMFLIGLLLLGIGMAVFAVRADRRIESRKRSH